jgi:hypothetical protein
MKMILLKNIKKVKIDNEDYVKLSDIESVTESRQESFDSLIKERKEELVKEILYYRYLSDDTNKVDNKEKRLKYLDIALRTLDIEITHELLSKIVTVYDMILEKKGNISLADLSKIE